MRSGWLEAARFNNQEEDRVGGVGQANAMAAVTIAATISLTKTMPAIMLDFKCSRP
jgi:hypothetical protein